MKNFSFHRPRSLEEALTLLGEFEKEGVRILAGGTDLLVMMKHESLWTQHLIDIKRIPGLREIRKDGDGFAIGAAVTLSEISEHLGVKNEHPTLVQAIRMIASPQIRNRGTIGGNICLDTKCLFLNRGIEARRSKPECLKEGGKICHIVRGAKRCFSIFCADSIPVLMSLNANVRVFGPSGSKVIPIKEIYSVNGAKPLKLNREIITDVLIPSPAPFVVYLKNRWRRSLDFPVVGLAMAVIPDFKKRKCQEVRIALTGLTSFPVPAKSAESIFKDGDIATLMDKEIIDRSAEEALNASHPISPMGGLGDYRRSQVKVLLAQAANKLLEQISEKRS